MKGTLNQLKDGLWYQNPTLVMLLGMCPTLATSTSVMNALGMGVSATIVLILTNTIISALRKLIPNEVRIAAYVVIVSAVVTVIDLLLQAYFPSISESLGIFIPLITVNCIILARAEAFAADNPPFRSAVDGLGMGLGFTLGLTAMATIREILGNGTFLGFPLFGQNFPAATLLVMPVGGFLTLGCLIALMQKITSSSKKKEGSK
ncbi:electron transport complex subunit RsxE [Oscillospiraceae bacterium OttesenSCG-928-G22]|nr:electron transport complex subunit RsxE [Oscillospiraceae bacterium OttesenSCG-928-G22]